MNTHFSTQTALMQSVKSSSSSHSHSHSNSNSNSTASEAGAGASANTVLPQRLQTILKLNNAIATNAYGMPKVIYKADQIPADYFERPPKEQQHLIELATVEVSYSEGLPVITDHGLLWEQLPWEPAEAYLAFSNYIKLHESHGYRALNLLLNEHPTANLPSHEQLNPEVRQERQEFLTLMREYHVYYCWSLRARAFDSLAQAAYERLRERRALQTENYHYLQTDNLIKKFVSEIDNVLGNRSKWDELSIPEFIKSMKTVMELQRVSVGLPAAAPPSVTELQHPDSPHGHSLETRLKLQARRQAAVEDPEANADKTLDIVMDSPELLAMAQELIAQTMLSQRKQNTSLSQNSDQTEDPRRQPDETTRVESEPQED